MTCCRRRRLALLGRYLGWKNTWRLNEASVSNPLCSLFPYSESTVCVVPVSDLKWFCTRMKSNDDGMNTTVFALCTADFRTDGSNYTTTISTRLFKVLGNHSYVLGKVVKPFIDFIFWT